MRADTVTFNRYNTAAQKSPRFVVAIIFDVASLYITSHTGITTVPGIVLDGALLNPSALSMKLVPDEGRTEIGAMSFELVDLDSEFTDEVRSKLGDGKGLRGKEVRLYVGYQGMDFTAFQRFCTQVVSDAEYDEGIYTIKCREITREQRKEIFEPKKTTLRDSVTSSATTIPVYVTTDFSTVFHGASYSDGPSSTVGYIKVEDEIIRYTGKTADSFTGCTRGVLNTLAVAHEVDSGTAADRRPKVEEYIYLELPAAKLLYAILTGVIYNDAATLPAHWHLGIATTWVRLSDFTGLGSDLWDTTLDTAGVVAYFSGLKKSDGKKFLESELYQLLGCYPVVYSDGTIGIKRMNHVLADAPYVVELNENNCVAWSGLKHEMDGLFNAIRVNWNWDGEDFTREKIVVDAASVAVNTDVVTKELSFKGLHGSRHTDAIVAKRIDALRDRYTYAPETMQVTVLPSLNRLEVGDIVRVKLPTVRDFAGDGDYIDRSFEIQQKSEDFATGDVTLSLFGSTGRASVDAPTSDTSPLPDAYYTAVGVNLSTVCTIVVVGGVGVIQPGTYNLTGNASMTASGAVYYYPDDLELADGATLTINNNVQIRVLGFFTVNGDIDGIGRGKAGVADSAGFGTIAAGTAGYIGNSRGMDGAQGRPLPRGGAYVQTVPCAFTTGANTAFPYLELIVSGSTLVGIPSDLRGTSGGAGGKITRVNPDGSGGTVASVGGTGGNSGAGLAIICRGLAIGASGSINLSGASSASTSISNNGLGINWPTYPGAGGAGSPGAFLLLLDGSGISLPDLSGGRFIASCGTVPVNGTPMPQRGESGLGELRNAGWLTPAAGYQDEALISAANLSNAAHRIQYVPETQTPAQDAADLPPAATSLSVNPGQLENVLTIGMPPAGTFDVMEIYAAITNDRTGAVLVDSVGGSVYRHQLTGGVSRFYWVRPRRGAVVGAFFPTSSTGGISGTTFARFVARGNCQIIDDVARKVGGSTAWDSDIYSPDQYLNGCFVTWRADQTNLNVIVGLNSDPTTDQNYTGIDYCILCADDGNAYIYESTLIASIGAYTTSTVFTITFDGKLIKYLKAGALVRQVPVQNLTLFMDSSFYSPNARISALQFGPLNAVTPSPWVARGNCIAGVTTARKSGGGSSYDSDVYSVDSYTACHVAFKPSQTNGRVMIALDASPLQGPSHTLLDWAWECDATGTAHIWEAGTDLGSFGSYTTSTEFAITNDGSNIRYYKDRVLIRTVGIGTQSYWASSCFHTPGVMVNSLHFGPGTSLEAVGTPGIEDNAVAEVAGSTDTSQTTSTIAESFMTISVVARPVPYKALVTVVADVWKTAGTFAECYLARLSGGVPSGTVSQPFTITATASTGERVALRYEFDASVNTAYDYSFWYSASVLANYGEARNISMQVELIKK